MKAYAYFPGCSLEKLALSYHQSTLESARRLDLEFQELDDWNCCGTTAYFAIDQLLSHTLSARNLALAEKKGLDMVAPCAGCYKNAYFTNVCLKRDADLAEHVNEALQEDDLHYAGTIQVYHLLEVFCNDVGVQEIKKRVTQSLNGLRVAPYYGCQIVRPRKDHEEVENPRYFEDLIAAMGATPIEYQLKMRCCGGSLLITSRKAAFSMVRNLLQNAVGNGAAVIATACPMCQVNLECYQQQINQEFGTKFAVPILYFTQLLGLALGATPKELGLGSELVSASAVLAQIQNKEASTTKSP
ncbi:MAG: CoB--CoM heterodisulfide reductase iron-sulfur subunit B family protein [Chloroflexi bacterium]|nr:CoB--CoM heterodisulfide reductase iron-sulfur subunit B family protein [Chloroflexota bacterium]